MTLSDTMTGTHNGMKVLEFTLTEGLETIGKVSIRADEKHSPNMEELEKVIRKFLLNQKKLTTASGLIQ